MADVRACKCENKMQDSLHGVGHRVFNHTAKGDLRCTVCGSEVRTGSDAKAKKK